MNISYFIVWRKNCNFNYVQMERCVAKAVYLSSYHIKLWRHPILQGCLTSVPMTSPTCWSDPSRHHLASWWNLSRVFKILLVKKKKVMVFWLMFFNYMGKCPDKKLLKCVLRFFDLFCCTFLSIFRWYEFNI